MDISLTDLILGAVFSCLIAYTAYRKKSLSPSGFYAATVLGTLIFALGRLFWAILILFFVTSSLLSKFKHGSKASIEENFAKTGSRDWLQVLANGVVGLGFAAAYWVTGNYIFAVGYTAALATVNADTWATEIGTLSVKAPVSILTFKPVATGVSGAVSLMGTSAAIAGAVFISLISGLGLVWTGAPALNVLAIITAASVGGIIGCLSDSLMGATIQAMYKCQVCSKITERKIHHQKPTILIRGWGLVQNDMVNLSSSLVGGLLAIALFSLLS